MDTKAQTVTTYNVTAARMAAKFRKIGARMQDIEKGFELVQKNNPNVFEIGCGDGRDAKEILKHTKNYLGVDISESMIKIAQEYAPEGRFEIVDIENYVFPTNLDLIFSFASLLHSNKNNIQKVLANALVALNTGGIFYISLKYDSYHEASKTDEFGTRTYYFYTPEDIKQLGGSAYTTVWEDVQELQGQKWFTIALRKGLKRFQLRTRRPANGLFKKFIVILFSDSHVRRLCSMPRYRMSFKKCHEVFPGDSRYSAEQRTFEAASDEEATTKADEIAGEEISLDNPSIHYQLEEYREVGSFSKTGKQKTATQFPRLSSAGLRSARKIADRQLKKTA